MNKYEFTLTFALPEKQPDPEIYLDALFEAGCDDALAGTGQMGMIALDFTREAKSAAAAVNSALKNVLTAIPDAELVEAKPDLVGLSDVADILQCSRQNVRKYMVNYAGFPKPAYSGAASLWHLFELVTFDRFNFPDSLGELSRATFRLNLEIQQRRYERTVAAERQ